MHSLTVSTHQLQMLLFVMHSRPNTEKLARFRLVTYYSLVDRGYIRLSKGRWYLTKQGRELVDSLKRTDGISVQRKVTRVVLGKFNRRRFAVVSRRAA